MGPDAWPGKLLYFDLLALTTLLLSAALVAVDAFVYLSSTEPGNASRALLVGALGLAVFCASFAWIAARLVRASLREARGA